MNRLRFGLILLPSFSSTVSSLLIALFVLLFSVWEFLQNIPFLSQSLTILENQISSIIGSGASQQSTTISTILDSELLNQFAYLLLWMLLGVLTYFAVVFLMIGRDDVHGLLHATSTNPKKKNALINEFMLRLFFRMFILIVWVFFIMLTVQLLLPVAISGAQAGASFNGLESMKFFLFSITIVTATFHIHVVLLRSLLMRIRLFGQADEIILHEKH